MLIVFTGDGKGKTTAALGQAIRALGNGMRVAFFQFVKSPEFTAGEDVFLRWVEQWYDETFVFRKGGRGFVGILGDALSYETHMEAAEETLKDGYEAVASGFFDLVVLDEVHVAIALGLLTASDVWRVLQAAEEKKIDVLCTGRRAPASFLERAHLVTEFREEKHPFSGGALARRGIEY